MITGNARVSTFNEPATNLQAVTPNDVTLLPVVFGIGYPRRLYVGVTGDITVLAVDDTTPVLLKAVPVGVLDVRAQKVMATGTTASQIVALW